MTKEDKLVMFQYKVIHNILFTQSSLHRDAIAESDVYPLSKTNLAPLVRPLHWNALILEYISRLVAIHERLSLNQSYILYGFFEKSAYWQS